MSFQKHQFITEIFYEGQRIHSSCDQSVNQREVFLMTVTAEIAIFTLTLPLKPNHGSLTERELT